MRLAAGQRAGIAAQEGKMRRELLTKRHVRCNSCCCVSLRDLLRGRPPLCNPGAGDGKTTAREDARPAPPAGGGTIGRLFCFQPDCAPLMAAERVCASAFGGSRKTAWLSRSEAGAAQVARGRKILGFQSDKDRRRKSEQDSKTDSHMATDEPAGKTRRRGPNDVGHALARRLSAGGERGHPARNARSAGKARIKGRPWPLRRPSDQELTTDGTT